jgi:DnaJ-domain-containing protein 1
MVLITISFNFVQQVFSQDDTSKNLNELVISDNDLIIIFSSFIASVIAIFLYLARHQILRKKLEYDMKDYESKKNKDYEKYHSDWTEDEFVGKKSFNKYDEEFRKLKQTSSFPDYYKILGIPKDSTQNEVKNQFRRLAKEWHPDKNPDPKTKEKMAEINKAYEVLSDKELRSNYDKYFDAL